MIANKGARTLEVDHDWNVYCKVCKKRFDNGDNLLFCVERSLAFCRECELRTKPFICGYRPPVGIIQHDHWSLTLAIAQHPKQNKPDVQESHT